MELILQNDNRVAVRQNIALQPLDMVLPAAQTATESLILVPDVEARATAVQLAWERHAALLSDADRQRFCNFKENNIDGYIKSIEAACKKQNKTSKTYRVAEWFDPFFQTASMHLPTVTKAAEISAVLAPNPSPLILGGIACVMNLSMGLLAMQRKIVRVLSRMSRKLSPILRYNHQIMHDHEVEMALIEIYGDILEFCKEVAKLLLDSKGEPIGGFKTFGFSLTSTFDRKFGDLVSRFEDHLDDLNDKAVLCDRKIAQGTLMLQWRQAREQQTSASELGSGQQSILANLNQQQSYLLDNRRFKDRIEQDKRTKMVINWIPSTAYLRHHEELCQARLEGTSGWFIRHEKYVAWKDSGTSQGLWVRGNSGCGKSILAAYAINDLDVEMDESIAVAFVYCKALEPDARESTHLACTLLKQLCQQSQSVDRSLESLYNRSGEGLGAEPGWSLVTSSIKTTLANFSEVFIVVDGLDECSDREKLAGLLSSLLLVKEVSVKAIAFSRPNYASLGQTFQDWENFNIDDGSTDDDINQYISSMITMQNLQVGTNELLVEELKKELLSKSERSFLYLSLSVQTLKDQSTPKQVRDAIKKVPSGLDGMYSSALKRIFDQRNAYKRETSISLLIWTMNAARPLTKAEMLEALAVRPGINRLDDEDIMPDIGDLTASCADLVVLSAEGTFELRHTSVKDYFDELGKSEDDVLEEIRARHADASKFMSDTCLTYLLLDNLYTQDNYLDLGLDELLAKRPFLTYAAVHCFKELPPTLETLTVSKIRQLANDKPRREICTSVLQKFALDQPVLKDLESTPLHFISWHGVPTVVSEWPGIEQQITAADTHGLLPLDYAVIGGNRSMTLWLLKTCIQHELTTEPISARWSAMHGAALRGWTEVLAELINQDYNVNFQVGDDELSPLMASAKGGHIECINLLVEKGANVAARGKSGETALTYAVTSGMEACWKPLLDAGADIHAKEQDGSTALHLSIPSASVLSIRLLLERGATVQEVAEKLSNQSAIHFAAEYNRADAIPLLLQYGASYDGVCDDGYTPLHVAAFYGSVAAAKQLVSAGANSEAKDEYQCLALHRAAEHGQVDFVKYLMEECNQMQLKDALDKDLETALHFAARGGHISVVRYLLDKGVTVDAVSKLENHTPLIEAINSNRADVVEAILSRGANVHHEASLKSSPLHYAAHKGATNLIEMFASAKADPNAKNEFSDTPLHFSARKGHFDFVKQLFETFPDIEVNAINYMGKPPLTTAVVFGSVPLVTFLMKEKEALLIVDNDQNAPLHLAASEGNEDIVNLVLTDEHLNAEGYKGRTPLYNAVARGHLGVVKLLLRKGAYMHLDTVNGYNALIDATRFKHFVVVKHLLDVGASPMCSDPDNYTLLHAACEHDDLELIETLLTKGCDGLAETNRKLTPFMIAVDSDNVKKVELLISKGYDGSKSSEQAGITCVHRAAEKGNLEMLNLLVSRGANVLAKDFIGRNAIHYAADGGQLVMVLALKKYGVPEYAHSDFEGTTLNFAVRSRCWILVSYLLQRIPARDLDIREKPEFRTALMQAVRRNAPKIAGFLRSAGADPLFRDMLDMNSFSYAFGNEAIEKSLSGDHAKAIAPCPYPSMRPEQVREFALSSVKTLLEESTIRTPHQVYLRISLLGMISMCLHILDKNSFKDRYNTLLQELYFVRGDLMLRWTWTCAFCSRKCFRGDVYPCMTCFTTTFCADCKAEFNKSPSKSPPEVFTVVATLEKEMQSLREVSQYLPGDFFDIARGLDHLPSLVQWIEDKRKAYEKWETKYRGHTIVDNYSRPGQTFLKLMKEVSEFMEKISEIENLDEASINRAKALSERWEKLQREHPGDCQDRPFTCSQHEFIAVNYENYVERSKDRTIFGEDRRITKQWLRDLIQDINRNSGGSSTWTGNRHETNPKKYDDATTSGGGSNVLLDLSFGADAFTNGRLKAETALPVSERWQSGSEVMLERAYSRDLSLKVPGASLPLFRNILPTQPVSKVGKNAPKETRLLTRRFTEPAIGHLRATIRTKDDVEVQKKITSFARNTNDGDDSTAAASASEVWRAAIDIQMNHSTGFRKAEETLHSIGLRRSRTTPLSPKSPGLDQADSVSPSTTEGPPQSVPMYGEVTMVDEPESFEIKDSQLPSEDRNDDEEPLTTTIVLDAPTSDSNGEIKWTTTIFNFIAQTDKPQPVVVRIIYNSESRDSKSLAFSIRMTDCVIPGTAHLYAIANAAGSDDTSLQPESNGLDSSQRSQDFSETNPDLRARQFSLPVYGPFDLRHPWT